MLSRPLTHSFSFSFEEYCRFFLADLFPILFIGRKHFFLSFFVKQCLFSPLEMSECSPFCLCLCSSGRGWKLIHQISVVVLVQLFILIRSRRRDRRRNRRRSWRLRRILRRRRTTTDKQSLLFSSLLFSQVPVARRTDVWTVDR